MIYFYVERYSYDEICISDITIDGRPLTSEIEIPRIRPIYGWFNVFGNIQLYSDSLLYYRTMHILSFCGGVKHDGRFNGYLSQSSMNLR
jgi:hypothetical protein